MASTNTLEWIREHRRHARGEALEVGSRRYKDHAFLDLRGVFCGESSPLRLTGCDLAAGENVDVVVDLAAPPAQVATAFRGRVFDTIFCISVLEHVAAVFAAAANLERLLRPGGALFVSVPFVFRHHGYPDDYWRFTPGAVVHLFPGIDFRGLRHSCVASLEAGDCMSLAGSRQDKLNRFLFRPRGRDEKLARKRAKSEGGAVPAYSLAPAMIHMLGFKP